MQWVNTIGNFLGGVFGGGSKQQGVVAQPQDNTPLYIVGGLLGSIMLIVLILILKNK